MTYKEKEALSDYMCSIGMKKENQFPIDRLIAYIRSGKYGNSSRFDCDMYTDGYNDALDNILDKIEDLKGK